jgi:hypothetical protein
VLNAVDLSSPEYYAYYGYYGYTAYAAAGVDSGGWEAKSGNGSDSADTDDEPTQSKGVKL